MPTRSTLTAAALAASLALASAPAGAIVPPRNCGAISASGKKYTIKADQLACSTARSHATRYLRTNKRPRGYKCNRFTGSALRAKCVSTATNPDRTIFMIKR